MASQHKVAKFGLEEVVREGLVDGKRQADILEDLNTELVIQHGRKKGKPPSISKAALERYLASIPEGTVAALHGSGLAAENASIALDFATRFRKRMATLEGWLADVDAAERTMTVDGKEVNLGPDWQARKAMMSEERRWMQLYVDLMERLYNAEQVQQFQEAVMEVIREADPETAQKVARALQSKRQLRAAAILGELEPA